MNHARLLPRRIVLALAIPMGACDGTEPVTESVGPPQRSNLVIESSDFDRNATLTNQAEYSRNLVTGTVHVLLHQVVGDTAAHLVTVSWDLRSGQVIAVHDELMPSPWDYVGKTLSCEGAACGGAIAVDHERRLVTLTNVTLTGGDSPETAALNGTIGW